MKQLSRCDSHGYRANICLCSQIEVYWTTTDLQHTHSHNVSYRKTVRGAGLLSITSYCKIHKAVALQIEYNYFCNRYNFRVVKSDKILN